MAAEMSIPFIGRVPVDVKFGQLVESQKIAGDDGGDSDADDEYEDVEVQKNSFEDDERLLVEKYRDCWSHPIFEGFTKHLLDKIEKESG
jgi:hypothetical protein